MSIYLVSFELLMIKLSGRNWNIIFSARNFDSVSRIDDIIENLLSMEMKEKHLSTR